MNALITLVKDSTEIDKPKYFIQCWENLKNFKSIFKSLEFIHLILLNAMRMDSRKNITLDIAPIIKDKLTNEDFLEVVLQTALSYQKHAQKLFKADKEKQKENIVTYQGLTHKQCLEKFFKILSYLL